MQAETSERASCRSDEVSCMLCSAQTQGKPGWSFEWPPTPAAPNASKIKPLQILDAEKKKSKKQKSPGSLQQWQSGSESNTAGSCNLTEGSKMDSDSKLPVKQHWVSVTVISLVMSSWAAPTIPFAPLRGQTAILEAPSLIYHHYLCITVPFQRPVLNNAK